MYSAVEIPSRIGTTSIATIFCAIAALTVFFLIKCSSTNPNANGLRLPPGPPSKPIIGNALDMPSHHPWETVTRWAKEYGDLVYVKVLGQDMIFVNSVEAAQELFETRSSFYSDRCDFPMMVDLIGHDWNFAFMRYSDRWRRYRKAFHQYFRPAAVSEYYGVQIKQTRILLQALYDSPNDFVQHIRHLAAATILEIVYGIEVRPPGESDPYIETAEKALAGAAEAGNPGAFLVDALPILKHVPKWMPGAGFRRKALAWRKATMDLVSMPFVTVKKALSDGTAGPSIVASMLEELSRDPEASKDAEDTIRFTMASAYGAASDTTVSAMTSFILAMVLYPDVQRKAQAELDSVIGTHRLLVFEERERLPYINALCKEVHRWNPVVPLCIPHRVMHNDTYMNYYIPGGSTVIGNAWAILRDEKLYGPKTDEFRPERFLDPAVKDPVAAFGFGRRICPGRHMADNSLFVFIAFILQAFDIRLAKDDQGNEIAVEPLYTPGFMSHPEPFRCAFVTRSDSAQKLILQRGED